MNSTTRNICPNHQTCLLISTPYIALETGKKEIYLSRYCHGGKIAWGLCKRYITKNAMKFCPDFVLPDSPGTPEEIIDEFDK